jgi:hypothetical protein
MGKAPDGKTSLSYEISETKNGLSVVIGGGEVDTHNSHSPSAPLLLVGSNSTHGGVLQETHEGYESWVHQKGNAHRPLLGHALPLALTQHVWNAGSPSTSFNFPRPLQGDARRPQPLPWHPQAHSPLLARDTLPLLAQPQHT